LTGMIEDLVTGLGINPVGLLQLHGISLKVYTCSPLWVMYPPDTF
jgi:hypothetical protein